MTVLSLTWESPYLGKTVFILRWVPGLCSSGTLASMMTSSNGNIFHITGLCEGISPVTGEFPSQRPVTWSFDVFFDQHWTNNSANHQNAGDLRCHHTHYDITVIFEHAWLLCKCSCCIPIFSFSYTSVSTFHDVMQHAVSCHIGPSVPVIVRPKCNVLVMAQVDMKLMDTRRFH